MAQATQRVKKIQTPSSVDAIAALIAANNAIKHYTATVDVGNMTAVTAVNTDVSVAGVKAGDYIIPIPPVTLEAGVAVQGATCPADGTIRVRTTNASAGAINPASATWGFIVVQNKQLVGI